MEITTSMSLEQHRVRKDSLCCTSTKHVNQPKSNIVKGCGVHYILVKGMGVALASMLVSERSRSFGMGKP